MREYGNIIGGIQVASNSRIEIRNPYSGELVGRVASADRATTEQVLHRSRSAEVHLQRFERHDLLNRMAARLEEQAADVSRMITDESGLCFKDTEYEVQRASDVLRFAAIESLHDDSEVFPCDVSRVGRARRIYTMRQPLHLIAAITPFNHPLNQVVHKIAPAIATNNKTILKPSQLTPLSAYYVTQLALDCGMPPDMVNVVSGETEDVAETIVASPLVDMITFTGGTATGKRIAAVAGYKRLVLELGGSSAMLVLADADPVQAAGIAVTGVFKNSGQRCTAIRRLLVHESIADEFVRLLAERVQSLKFGDPYDPAVDVGTVISERAATEIERRVELSVKQGAKVVIGHARRGAVYAPTVLDHVRNDHAIVVCETFGPVAPVIRFRTLDEAIRIANDIEFGLSGAVVSNHWPSIQRVITELETGTVNVSEAPSYRLEWSPFGGVKSSGLGYKEGVIEAMKSMTYVKTYSLPWDMP
ncbi:MAG TPA: aldehyde dehydrogenase family protein [Bryobacteraceae bacterium]|nr:aldehyde dehydrogenase family protein [Bryobacteraceae bacterium]